MTLLKQKITRKSNEYRNKKLSKSPFKWVMAEDPKELLHENSLVRRENIKMRISG
jgi:hypothetical protein